MTLMVISVAFLKVSEVLCQIFNFWSSWKNEHEEYDEYGRAISHRSGHKGAYAGAVTENVTMATTNASKAVTAGLADLVEGDPNEEITEAITEAAGGEEEEGANEDWM